MNSITILLMSTTFAFTSYGYTFMVPLKHSLNLSLKYHLGRPAFSLRDTKISTHLSMLPFRPTVQ